MHRTIGGPAIKNGLLFIADASGLAHCLDARTGKQHWTCDLLASTWATPLIVGDHVYAADQDGDIAIFALSADATKSVKVVKQPNAPDSEQPIHEINVTIPVYTTPVAAHGVLYIATFNRLFAISHEGK
ncbi:MAG: PQQ-binding-like beta-propeller repeat protein [Planctomycetia bacterium]|nr:PQQ-binding-like beta-propeller repeat protein [Planctomycetia bacterium]